MSRIRPLALAILALALYGALHGCATFQADVQKVDKVVTSPAAQPVILAAMFAATATAETHGVTAAQLNAIAHQALAADQGAGATLSAVSGVVNAQLVKLKVPAGDQAAIAILEVALDAAIDVKLGTNPTLAQTQAAAADVFQALATATGG